MQLKKVLLQIIIFITSCGFAQTEANEFEFFVFGDMPYHIPEDNIGFQRLIETLNTQKQVFNVFVGDFKSSATPCSDTAFLKIRNYFNDFNKPLIYTPGDNEWTDCNKTSAGAFNTDERLDKLRKIFFNKPEYSLGKNKLKLISESSIIDYRPFVENQMWHYNNISFATIHLVGSNNNLKSTGSNKEFTSRSKANLFWLHNLFKTATKQGSLGIVIFEHADMIYPDKGTEGFKDFLTELQKLVKEYAKPVLLVNGDSHKFLVDKPFSLKGKTLMNFTRLQVFGEEDMHAVKVHINPKNTSLFEIQQFLIPGNN